MYLAVRDETKFTLGPGDLAAIIMGAMLALVLIGTLVMKCCGGGSSYGGRRGCC